MFIDREFTKFFDIDSNYLRYRNIEEKVIINQENILFQNKLAYLVLNNNILPSWINPNEKIPIMIKKLHRNLHEGEILAHFELNNKKYPAIIKTKNKIIFNFNPIEAINHIKFENYLKVRRPFYTHLPIHMHILPGFIRHSLKALIYKKKKALFPSWPIDKSVDTLRYITIASLLHPKKIKQRSVWPKNKKYAITITHDIETAIDLPKIKDFMTLEKKYNIKSCWNIVGKHRKNKKILNYIKQQGHEIGSHGYSHDNKLSYLTTKKIIRRFQKIKSLISNYNIKGFRSPSLLRSKRLSKVINNIFEYDMSFPDTERNSQISNANGVSTVFPYKLYKTIILPLTIPQDSMVTHENALKIWKYKLNYIKKVGGIAVFNIHLQPHLSGNKKGMENYKNILELINKDKDAYIDLPYNIANYWKKHH